MGKIHKEIIRLYENQEPISKELYLLAKESYRRIQSSNKELYYRDVTLSRLKRTLNNSKQYIRKHWKNRKEVRVNNLIKKHIETIRTTKQRLRGLNGN